MDNQILFPVAIVQLQLKGILYPLLGSLDTRIQLATQTHNQIYVYM